MSAGTVESLSIDDSHRFSKRPVAEVDLIAGIGIVGDAHSGTTVQHLSRLERTPGAPNLRQVHLIHRELLDQLRGQGFAVAPGDLGENITAQGVDLLGLARGTRLMVGNEVELEVTGLRNPCAQIETFLPGLLKAVVSRAEDGGLIRKAGVMAIVTTGGRVRVGDHIVIEAPERFERLEPV